MHNRLKVRSQNPWTQELESFIRGASGGFLFGIPLLYTMEVWWIGSSVSMPRVLMALVLTFGIVLMLNQTAGFRQTTSGSLLDVAMDAVEAMAIGLLCTGITLILLREITLETPLNEALGKVVYEGMAFTLGVALANQFLSGDDSRNGNSHSSAQEGSKRGADDRTLNATLSDIGGTLIGATIIALNIAPTDEILLLASAVSGIWLLGVMVASLLISYAIVFEAGFANQAKRQQHRGIFQRPISETIAAYLISLLAAAAMLMFFDKLNGQDPWQVWLSYSILLGLPATVGGAAGRLAV